MASYPSCPDCGSPLALQGGSLVCLTCASAIPGIPDRGLSEVLKAIQAQRLRLQQEAVERSLKGMRAAAAIGNWPRVVSLAWLVLWRAPSFFPGEAAGWLRAVEIAFDGFDSSLPLGALDQKEWG